MSRFQRSYSQAGEDIIISFVFENLLHIDRIVYLDIGANDPIWLNNTYLFYKRGFRGVCVDPNPVFTSPYRRRRRKDTFVCAGIGDGDAGGMVFFDFDPNTLGTFDEEEAEVFLKMGHSLLRKYKVPVMTVDHLLETYFDEAGRPNLLSLDTEGLELRILQSIDFELWRPTVVCVETINYGPTKELRKLTEVSDFLEGNDYFVYADTFNNSIMVDRRYWDTL